MCLLVTQVLTICIKIMDELIPGDRASRDFRVKFPDDVIQDNLAGQLWFGAEVIIFISILLYYTRLYNKKKNQYNIYLLYYPTMFFGV